MAYLVAHVTTALLGLIVFVLLLGRLSARRTSQSTLAWLLGFVFVPYAAIPLYLLLGARKFPARAKGPASEPAAGVSDESVPPIARVLGKSGVAAPTAGNQLELFGTGEDAYERLLALIREAESSIELTTFILGWDECGKTLVAALAERASQGVQVRVILDAVGCLRSHRPAALELTRAGAEVRSFMPLSHSPLRGRNNLRSHRKLAVFDGCRLFTGGMNLALEYLGPRGVPTREPRWRDVAAVCEGPVVAAASELFESDWRFCRGKLGPRPHAPPTAAGDVLAQFVASGPDFATDTLYDLFLTAIFAARERIGLIAPYYVPDDTLHHALVLAARRGVHTELVVPSVSNHALADIARRGLLRELAEAGVTLRYYDKGMVHAKAMAIDACFAYVGSPNFDMRSLFLNYENALCVYSPGAVASVRGYIDALSAECTSEAPKQRRRPLLEQLARFLAPEL